MLPRLSRVDRCVLEEVPVFSRRPPHGATELDCSGDGVLSALRRLSAWFATGSLSAVKSSADRKWAWLASAQCCGLDFRRHRLRCWVG